MVQLIQNRYTFSIMINYRHKIAPFKGLVEEACLVMHDHIGVKIDIEVDAAHRRDFKQIKMTTLEVLGKLATEPMPSLNEWLNNEDASTERFLDVLFYRLQLALSTNVYELALVSLRIQETPKYGMVRYLQVA